MSKMSSRIVQCLIVSALVLIFLLFQYDAHRWTVRIQWKTVEPKKALANSHTKTILIYKPFWGFEFVLPWGKTGFINTGCPVTDCYMTSDEKAVAEEDFDAVIFSIPSFREAWRSRRRKPHQMFIFFATEPPKLYGMPDSLQPFDGFFNRTFTYLKGSDFYFPYGSVETLPTAPETEADRLEMMRNVLQPPYNPARNKTGIAVLMATTCDTPSNRLKYVQYLQKYMTVDINSRDGVCGGRQICQRNSDDCFDYIEKTYKFYLSFENSICDQYVTEKFYNFLARNIVPVVLGGANYSAIAPPHSFINALDYTPKQLAEYLLKLHNNDTLYAEYFWWKPHYRVSNPFVTGRKAVCDICAALHNSTVESKTVSGLHDWYYTNSHCVENPTFNPN